MTRTRTNWKVRDHVFTIGERTLIMGVLNVTPDSFSDGGKYYDPDAAVAHALELEAAGADILDIGAESTRPGSERINAGEELRRLIPVLKRLKEKVGIPISVDTYKTEVAEKALEHGASIINDVSALTWEPDIVKPVIKYDAGLILNHMRGNPETWVRLGPMKDVMGTLLSELEAAVHRATRAGVARDRVVIDPGIGFGKRGEQNNEILARLAELHKFGVPVLVAASRKSFLGHSDDPRALEFATAAAVATAILHGAAIVRVHDVASMRPVVQATDAIIEAAPDKEEKPARQAIKPRTEQSDDEKRRKPIRPSIKPIAPRPKPIAPPVEVKPEISVPEAAEFEAPESEAPEIVEQPAPEVLPRRPFERRPVADSDRPQPEDRKAPAKKFFEWRKDEPKKPERRSTKRQDDRPERRPAAARPRPDRDGEDRRPFQRADSRPPMDRRSRPDRDAGDRKPTERRGQPFNREDRGGGRDRPSAARPFKRETGDRPRPTGGRPVGDRPPGNRPPAGRPTGGRAPAGRPTGGRPPAGRPSGGRPAFPPRDRDSRAGRPPSGPRSNQGDRERPSGPPRPPARGGGQGPSRPAKGGGAGYDRPPRPGGRGGDDRPPRPAGPGGNRRPPFGGPKRGGSGPPPRGPRKRT